MNTFEANFDGLVGPTHNYAGLSSGNKAATSNAGDISNPKAAALQGLAKMKALYDLGLVQGVLPPLERPNLATLRQLGFSGKPSQMIKQAFQYNPLLLDNCYSASSMWTANAATISPSQDCADNKVHFTPANLQNMFHRSLEPQDTGLILKAVFAHPDHFVHHSALPSHDYFGDEGAANHNRLCDHHGDQGIEWFVYGNSHLSPSASSAPERFPSRQTLEASHAIARLHQLDPDKVIFTQQNPEVIDLGVFHNDVIAVTNRNLLFCHEKAFLGQQQLYDQLRAQVELTVLEVPNDRISVKEAVSSYLFNSQLISLPDSDDMLMVVPSECEESPAIRDYLQEVLQHDNPIRHLKAFDLRQSMKNGGGPACLRLRVVLNEQELHATRQSCLMSDGLYNSLAQWVETHYRDRIAPSDLADPALHRESKTALDELTKILKLGSIYSFQKVSG